MIVLRWVFAAVLAVAAIYLAVMGGRLLSLGGSAYYLLVGVAYLLAAWWMAKQDRRSAYVVFGVLAVTILWSFVEVGTEYWGWLPRLLAPLGFAIAAALMFTSVKERTGKVMLGLAVIGVVGFAGFLARGFMNVPYVSASSDNEFVIPEVDNEPLNWTAYSRDTMGTRYSPFTQINRDNVQNLELAWTYETGRDTSNGNLVDQNTPMQIGNTLYSCTPENVVHAINATTGEGLWTFDPDAEAIAWQRCRGLGYYEMTQADLDEAADQIDAAAQGDDADAPTDDADTQGTLVTTQAPDLCQRRIVGNTVDGRLYQLDATTGELCTGFGDGGMVNLREGMFEYGAEYYYQTSAPLVAGDKIVVGGWISDNQSLDEPSGAIRAFDVITGELIWAFDPGNPDQSDAPAENETYVLGTPNMWTHAAYDPELDMIYAPMGNAGTDYWNANRPEASEPFNAALVALDGATGQVQWSFQHVHHDLWDYDLPSQPALLDMQNDAGEMVPALVLLTKRGEIFTFDRRDGTPITEIEERPVPTNGSVEGNIVAETQPYSVGMPNLTGEPLTAARAWGMTMFDQLTCRISYEQNRHDGEFTPPGLDWSLTFPGPGGGFNWGSASYDPVNRLLFVNDMRMTYEKRLMERPEYEEVTETRVATPDGHGLAPMTGTPYGTELRQWNSPLGVPCMQPPFGTVTAIDLDDREIAWQMPSGTATELGPLGTKLGLPLTMGMPGYAGTSVTAGGIVFFAGTQDYFLRGYDAETGEELLKLPLPAGGSATPMTYISPENGKEYVLLSVGGAAYSPVTADYVMAFTLPDAE
ncbi:MAG: membrane-bound PQQ-dependent dehydrogenase, glucose/quinate/shikimate family [Pseudomonadota bacterium]|nr:membrane-bound PQQ-dependent dehydrogenase, glucose/quinate/shikimate family [Pseudomonadota bacterium]